jgi:KDO2-lipid IV(A) lauroyltransferase
VKWGPFARALLRLGDWVGSLVFFLGIRRGVALDGLRRAFPQVSEAERRQIARAAYRQLGVSLAEVLLLRRRAPEDFEAIVRFEGWERFDEALAKGHGVVAAVAHFGNFELLPRAAARRGVRLAVIVRDLQDTFGRWLLGDRARQGVQPIAASGSSKAALEVLRGGGVLAIAIDQNMQRKRGIFVDFFGTAACTTPAAAVFALRAGAPILAIFPLRQPDGTHLVRVFGPFETDREGHAAVQELTQALTTAVEQQVREHPDHWYWVHRRWKTRPEPK